MKTSLIVLILRLTSLTVMLAVIFLSQRAMYGVGTLQNSLYLFSLHFLLILFGRLCFLSLQFPKTRKPFALCLQKWFESFWLLSKGEVAGAIAQFFTASTFLLPIFLTSLFHFSAVNLVSSSPLEALAAIALPDVLFAASRIIAPSSPRTPHI